MAAVWHHVTRKLGDGSPIGEGIVVHTGYGIVDGEDTELARDLGAHTGWDGSAGHVKWGGSVAYDTSCYVCIAHGCMLCTERERISRHLVQFPDLLATIPATKDSLNHSNYISEPVCPVCSDHTIALHSQGTSRTPSKFGREIRVPGYIEV